MKNNLYVEKNKKNKLSWRIILGVIVSLLLVFSVDVILWAIGVLGTTKRGILLVFLELIFVFSMGTILWAIEFWNNNKK